MPIGPGPKGLFPNHVLELRDSGLTNATIEAAGIYSEANVDKIARILDWKSWLRKNGHVMVIPYHDAAGDVVLRRLKPVRPVKFGSNSAKYLSPKGSGIRAYFPPGVHDAAERPEAEVIITEGEKKSLAGTQVGIPTIGLLGVEGWHAKRSLSLLADLERFDWKGRDVYIAFDSDLSEKPAVQENECLLAEALKNRGANVKVLRFSDGPNGEKVGLDDFLVTNGMDLGPLRRLMNEALDPEPPLPGELKAEASAIDPATEAERFVGIAMKDGHPKLRYWRGAWWYWTAGRYREVADDEIRAKVVRFVSANFKKVTKGVISNVMEHVKALSILTERTEPPRWIADEPGYEWPPGELLVTKNSVVHLPSIGAEDMPWVPSTPALFATTALDFDFVPTEERPEPTRWLRFLNELWADQPDCIEALQLWFGYCLTADTSQQKMLCMFGPPRSGKGTISRTLTALVGASNVASPTLSSFSQNFGLWPLVGKTLGIISDARWSGRQDAAVITERLLSITGEDCLTIDQKHRACVTCRLSTRLLLLSNELPRLTDSSGALVKRMIVLPMRHSWYGKEDHGLAAAIEAELPGVLWWAIDGWRLLRQRGRLLQPTDGDETVQELDDLSSPIRKFLGDCCDVDPEAKIPRANLFLAYRAWCQRNGRGHIEDQAGFGRNLRAAVPTLQTKNVRVEKDKDKERRVRYYIGVQLRSGYTINVPASVN